MKGTTSIEGLAEIMEELRYADAKVFTLAFSIKKTLTLS
jgi:hypothetical protein